MSVVTAAAAAAIALAGCNSDGTSLLSTRDLQPISPQMLAEINQKDMAKDSPILVRIFKEEAELEVWKQDRSGRFALLKTYPICRWSGELGPKIRQGDRQAPEGFYTISPAQMNPNSSYYLAFNIGYPNAYDRAWRRTGSNLMVHGDCSSRGCYAMTDPPITEIYALARESFFGGQRAFQVQAYPFRMTPLNMAKHRNSPHMRFWKMLKRGYDHFAVTHLEPKVDVCEKRYVFDAEPPAGSTRPLNFSPAGRCPAYRVQEDVIAAVLDKQRRDEYRTAQLITRGTATVPIRTGRDGGMNPLFASGLKDKGKMRNGAPDVRVLATNAPPNANPELTAAAAPEPVAVTGTVAADVPVPRAAPQRNVAHAAAGERSLVSRVGSLFGFASDDKKTSSSPGATRVASSNPSLLGRMKRMIGLQRPQKETARPTNRTSKRSASARSARRPHSASAAAHPRPQSAPAPKPAAVAPAATTWPPPTAAAPTGARNPQPKPQPRDKDDAPPLHTASNGAKKNAGLVTGAAPVVPAGSFNSRWFGKN